jgi:hypothetical protein
MGWERSFGTRKMHGGMEHSLQTDNIGRSWDFEPQTNRLRFTDKVALVAAHG